MATEREKAQKSAQGLWIAVALATHKDEKMERVVQRKLEGQTELEIARATLVAVEAKDPRGCCSCSG